MDKYVITYTSFDHQARPLIDGQVAIEVDLNSLTALAYLNSAEREALDDAKTLNKQSSRVAIRSIFKL